MKKHLLTLLFLCLSGLLSAQITLRNTFDGASATITSLNDGSILYYSMDVANKECRIYDEGFDLEKTIAIPVPEGFALYDIQYVTDRLFDSDDRLEMAITYYRYDTLGYYYEYGGMIVNENSSVLLNIPGSGYLSLAQPSETDYQLFAYVYDYSVYPSTLDTKVYQLPGSWLATGLNEKNRNLLRPRPNPTDEKIIIPLADKQYAKYIEVFNNAGQCVIKAEIKETSGRLSLKTRHLPGGIYHFSIQSENGTIQSGTFIKK